MTMVFEKIMISQQVAAKKGVSIQFMDEFYRIQKEEGFSSFYNGWRAYFVLAFKPAIENAVFDRIRSYLINARQSKILSGMEAFLLGALARAVGKSYTILLYIVKKGSVLFLFSLFALFLLVIFFICVLIHTIHFFRPS